MARREKSKKESPEPTRSGRVDWGFVERIFDTPSIRTLYLFGPPGCGKSYAALHKGPNRQGALSVTLTEETPAAELRGMWIPKGNEFVWRDGPFVEAMRRGLRLVVNEIQYASADVIALLYPVLESVATARLTLPTNETVQPAEGFRCICTANEPPTSLPLALQDRFDATVEIDAPHPEALALLSDPLRRAALQSLGLEPERAVSFRAWLKLDELREVMGLEDACRAVFGRERGAQIHDALALSQGELAF